jgi:integrase
VRDAARGRASSSGTVTLQDLWDRYQHAARLLDNSEHARKDAETRAQILIGHFGPKCDVRTLSEQDVREFTTRRLAGGITYLDHEGKAQKTSPAKVRSAEADMVLLYAMLRWATTVRISTGMRWLPDHPLAGVPRPREQNPRRPVATYDRFIKTRRAMQRLARHAASDTERARWIKMELALVLAEATGRRLGSIRQLRWDDIDFEKRTIRWRAEADKKGRESTIPVTAKLVEELRDFRRRLCAVGGWVFTGERLPDQPMDRHLFDRWLAVAEQAAGVPKLEGGLWHPYRRKWATERKHLSLKDVAAAGGWRDVETLLTCYQQPDQDTLLAVMSEPRKLRDRAAAGA